jgi:hypothetical protein
MLAPHLKNREAEVVHHDIQAIDVFTCTRIPIVITVSGCAAVRTKAVHQQACVGCEVGASHASGSMPERWPDGTPIVRVSTLVRVETLTTWKRKKSKLQRR